MNANGKSLADLTYDQLKYVMYDRLHSGQTLGPPIDPRVGPEPFEWLTEQFQRGDAGLRNRMTVAMGEFLSDLTDSGRWPESARGNLLDLVQDCGEEMVDDVRRLIRTRALLDLPHAGPPAHAGLLKCLVSLGHHGTSAFWMQQFRLLGPEYGALIFSALLDHGLDVAVRHLPELSANEHACRQIRLLLPLLKDRFGAEAVERAFQARREQLSESACEVFASVLDADFDLSEADDDLPALGTLKELAGESGTWTGPAHHHPLRLRDMIFSPRQAA